MARFLKACGAIPVYRRQDDPDKMDKNAEAFAACFATLAAGRPRRHLPGGHDPLRVPRPADQDGRGAHRPRLRVAPAERRRRRAARPHPGRASPSTRASPSAAACASSFGEPIPLGALSRRSTREDPVKAVDALTTADPVGHGGEIVHVDRLDRASPRPRGRGTLPRPSSCASSRTSAGCRGRQIDTVRLSRSIADAAAYFEDAMRPSGSSGSASTSQRYRATARRLRDARTRPCASGSPAGRRASASGAGGRPSIGLPVFAYGLTTQRPALPRAALDRPAHGDQGDQLRDHAAPRQHRGRSRSSGASRPGSSGASRGCGLGARLSPLAPGEQPPRLPLPARPRPASERSSASASSR